jgi:hypothetical protein
MLAGDDAPAPDLEVSQAPGAHLVIERVAGKPADRRGLVHGVGRPVYGWLAGAAIGVSGAQRVT